MLVQWSAIGVGLGQTRGGRAELCTRSVERVTRSGRRRSHYCARSESALVVISWELCAQIDVNSVHVVAVWSTVYICACRRPDDSRSQHRMSLINKRILRVSVRVCVIRGMDAAEVRVRVRGVRRGSDEGVRTPAQQPATPRRLLSRGLIL